jgi:ABC-type Fe3+ transport system permease subunit
VKHGEKVAPIAALVSALSCLACCLPFGIAAAAGIAGLSVVLDGLRPYLLAISGVLLLFGLWQLYRSPAACSRRTRTGLTVFWTCTVLVAMVAFQPQLIAAMFAGGLPGRATTTAADLSLNQLRADFNDAADQTRVIVLLSPT